MRVVTRLEYEHGYQYERILPSSLDRERVYRLRAIVLEPDAYAQELDKLRLTQLIRRPDGSALLTGYFEYTGFELPHSTLSSEGDLAITGKGYFTGPGSGYILNEA
jgi:hypothetical protein